MVAITSPVQLRCSVSAGKICKDGKLRGKAAERHDEGLSSASRVRTMPIGLGILAVMMLIPSPQLGLRSAERA